MNNNPAPQTFWDHLEEFRGELLKIAAIYLAATTLLFLSKDQLFQIVLAPTLRPSVTSCKTIVHYHKQESGIDTIRRLYLDFTGVACIHLCMYLILCSFISCLSSCVHHGSQETEISIIRVPGATLSQAQPLPSLPPSLALLPVLFCHL